MAGGVKHSDIPHVFHVRLNLVLPHSLYHSSPILSSTPSMICPSVSEFADLSYTYTYIVCDTTLVKKQRGSVFSCPVPMLWLPQQADDRPALSLSRDDREKPFSLASQRILNHNFNYRILHINVPQAGQIISV